MNHVLEVLTPKLAVAVTRSVGISYSYLSSLMFDNCLVLCLNTCLLVIHSHTGRVTSLPRPPHMMYSTCARHTRHMRDLTKLSVG
jgi:hypothetical protein